MLKYGEWEGSIKFKLFFYLTKIIFNINNFGLFLGNIRKFRSKIDFSRNLKILTLMRHMQHFTVWKKKIRPNLGRFYLKHNQHASALLSSDGFKTVYNCF